MISLHHEIFGRQLNGLFKIPFLNSNMVSIGISTRYGDIIVKHLDNSIINYTTLKFTDLSNLSNYNTFNQVYSNIYTGDLEVTTLNGNSDVYSIAFYSDNGAINENRYNIQDIGLFYAQFPSLYSIRYYIFYAQDDTKRATIKGNMCKIGASVEIVNIETFDVLNRTNDVWGNIDEMPINSQLKYWKDTNTAWGFRYFGNLANLPISINYFAISGLINSSFTYTAGRTWASSFDTLDLGNASLSPADTDNLLNDMANSITTAIGSKVIRLANCYRTQASDTAVAYLQSLGFTITVLGISSKILDLPLQNNFTDTTGINTMVAGGTSNLPTFTLEGGEYAATFNGSQSLKTNANFVINSDKISISFWMKTSQTGIAVLQELSSNSDNKNAFATAINVEYANKFSMQNKKTSNSVYNAVYSTSTINQNSWHHVCVVSDRYLNGNNETKIYVDNVLANVVFNNFDSSGNYINDILYIGQRGGSSLGFNGQMKFLKIFNYPLSTTEITNLFNKTM